MYGTQTVETIKLPIPRLTQMPGDFGMKELNKEIKQGLLIKPATLLGLRRYKKGTKRPCYYLESVRRSVIRLSNIAVHQTIQINSYYIKKYTIKGSITHQKRVFGFFFCRANELISK